MFQIIRRSAHVVYPRQFRPPDGQRRAKLFAEALRMEIAAAGDNHQALRRIARALLAEAYKGNIAAITMLADRLDGKVPQPVGGSEELGPTRLHISWSAGPHQETRTPASPQEITDDELTTGRPLRQAGTLDAQGA